MDNKFPFGRESLKDYERRDRPMKMTTTEIITIIEGVVLQNRRLKVKKSVMSSTSESIRRVLREYLGLNKITTGAPFFKLVTQMKQWFYIMILCLK